MEATCPSFEWALDGVAWQDGLVLGLGLRRLLLHPLLLPLAVYVLKAYHHQLQELQEPLQLEPPPPLEPPPRELQGQQPGALPVGTLAEALFSEEICWHLGYMEKGLYVCLYLVLDCY